MSLIRPISDLRNKSNQISELVHTTNEPVFITRNGQGDMVVMSLAHYRQMELKQLLVQKLAVAQAERAAGGRGEALGAAMKDIRQGLREAH